MKNYNLYFLLIIVSTFAVSSCASRKYGCPNSTGMKVQTTKPVTVSV